MNQRTSDISAILGLTPVLPVLVIDQVAEAVPLGRALIDNGLRVLEITLRTPNALRVIACLAGAFPEVVIGAGTVTTPKQLEEAAAAGASFAVSPGLTPELARAAADSEIPLLPGVMTPSEVMAARDAGFGCLKLFPAQQAGGVGMLKALAGPFPELVFCPTGGIDYASAPSFLSQPNVACVGGSWVVPSALHDAGDWDGIAALARQASALERRRSA